MKNRFSNFALTVVLVPIFLVLGYYGPGWGLRAYRAVFPLPAYELGNYEPWLDAAGTRVVVFSKTTCPWCERTRALLDERSVKYQDYPIDQSADARERYEKLGENGLVPVILIGARKIRGFDVPAIIDALAVQEQKGAP